MVLPVADLRKPGGKWCEHCSTRRNCDIYDDRPGDCREFYCGWLTNEELGDEWKPNRSKIVLVGELDGNRIAAWVHPKRPDAWKREPFYSTLKALALDAAPHRGQVVAYVGRRAYVIFPDRDVDLGIVSDDEHIVTREIHSPAGIRLEAIKIHKNDPRLKNRADQSWNIATTRNGPEPDTTD